MYPYSSILLLTIGGYIRRRQHEIDYTNIQNKNNIANDTKEVGACDIIEPLPTNYDPGKANALRRKFQLSHTDHDVDDDCYLNHYLPYFVNYTRNRLREKNKHLILHM